MIPTLDPRQKALRLPSQFLIFVCGDFVGILLLLDLVERHICHQEVLCLNPTTGPEMKSQKVAINLMTDVSFDRVEKK
jgi:hypothetical protein